MNYSALDFSIPLKINFPFLPILERPFKLIFIFPVQQNLVLKLCKPFNNSRLDWLNSLNTQPYQTGYKDANQ